MSAIVKLASGNWRTQVRRKGRYASSTFRRRKDAEEWAIETERSIDQGGARGHGSDSLDRIMRGVCCGTLDGTVSVGLYFHSDPRLRLLAPESSP